MSPTNYIHSKTTSLIMVMLCTICLISVSMVFYLTMPFIQSYRSTSDAMQITQQVSLHTSADYVIYWTIVLEDNAIDPVAIINKRTDTSELIKQFTNDVKHNTITSSYTSIEFKSLIEGSAYCEDALLGVRATSVAIVKYFEKYSNAYVCLIPVKNRAHAIVGQVSIGWNEKPSQDDILKALTKTQNILKE